MNKSWLSRSSSLRLAGRPVRVPVALRVAMAIGACAMALAPAPALGQSHVRNSPHDLSRNGPGPVRAVDEGQVCIFCHTPHNAAPDTPLWNRFNAPRHYRIYRSSTTDARIGQPTGDSKLCLSCHDGVLAVGLLRSRGETDRVTTTITTLRPEHGGLGTDLSDDHPISFRYDRALSAADPQLRIPDTISHKLPLGKHGELECTTCHDPHNNRLGNFLRVTPLRSAICVSCHQLDGWRISAHANSCATITGRDVDPNETLDYRTVADNGCSNCHKIHTAPQKERLLRHCREEDNCLNCHSGRVSVLNIQSEIRKTSGHNPRKYYRVHDAAEDPLIARAHVECVDCHNPHAAASFLAPDEARNFAAGPRLVGPELQHVRGLSVTGRYLERSRFEYEICLKCHSEGPRLFRETITRSVNSLGVRRDFRTSNPSFHPVFGIGRNQDVPSLVSPWRETSVMTCTDCHDSDNARSRGGSGPNGPHGSIYRPLLAERYSTGDYGTESADRYALCYRCHERSSILSNDSFPLHRLHIVTERTPCSVCHDPHGVPPSSSGGDHSHLINFDTSVVRPSEFSRRIEFEDTGQFRGSCTLRCHDFSHEDLTYQR